MPSPRGLQDKTSAFSAAQRPTSTSRVTNHTALLMGFSNSISSKPAETALSSISLLRKSGLSRSFECLACPKRTCLACRNMRTLLEHRRLCWRVTICHLPLRQCGDLNEQAHDVSCDRTETYPVFAFRFLSDGVSCGEQSPRGSQLRFLVSSPQGGPEKVVNRRRIVRLEPSARKAHLHRNWRNSAQTTACIFAVKTSREGYRNL